MDSKSSTILVFLLDGSLAPLEEIALTFLEDGSD
jgi:hypothetical protein